MATAGAAPEEDPGKASRVVGRRYRHNRRGEGLGVVEIWTGSRWLCDHGRERNRCKECGGASICEHGDRGKSLLILRVRVRSIIAT